MCLRELRRNNGNDGVLEWIGGTLGSGVPVVACGGTLGSGVGIKISGFDCDGVRTGVFNC